MAAAALSFFVALWRANIYRDRLLVQMYTLHHEIWLQEGNPKGWKWRPPGSITHPLQKWWPRLSHCWNDPPWLGETTDMIQNFRSWQKATRLGAFIFWPLAVIFGSLAVLVHK